MLLAALAAIQAPTASLPPAQPVTAPQPASPAALAAAERLIRLMGVEASMDRMLAQRSPMFATSVMGILATQPDTKPRIDAIIAKNPANRDRMLGILSDEFRTSMRQKYPALEKKLAEEYAAALTTDELNAINAFYSSGPGAKALKLLPELQTKMAGAGRELGKTAGEEAANRAFDRIFTELSPETKSTKS